MSNNEVILVDEQDRMLGTMEKMEAHRLGVLHRAFSVFIFNKEGEMLLQQRALDKYHNGGLWTNACCSHPRPGEENMEAAVRRLNEEMGFTTPLQKVFNFTYKAIFDNGLTEHEFDHVFKGIYNGIVKPNKNEVHAFSFQKLSDIQHQIEFSPETFTIWFRIAFAKFESLLEGNVISQAIL